MSSVIVVDKKSLDQSTVSGSRIVLETASKVHTQLYRSDVAEFVQDGNDLILKLKNGKTIVIVNFFVAHEDETSDVLFKDDNGIPWLPLLLGGAGVAGGLALASSGGGDNHNGGAASAPKNHVPVAGLSNQPIETQEDQPKKGQITDVTDKDGDELTYKVGEAPKNGTVTVDEKTGAYTYTPKSGVTGDDKFTVVVSDGKGGEVTVTVPVTVTINVSNDSKITTEITPKGEITGTTDNVEKGPVKLTITGTDKNGNPVTIERTVELDRPDGSSKGQYTYQLTPEDGIVDGSKVTVEAKTIDRQGDTIHADTELPGHSGEETPGLDLVVPTIEITQVATDEKVTWGEEGKEGFEVKGTTTGVEAGQSVAVTFDKTVDGQPVTVEATVGKDGSWTAKITPEQAAKLLEGSVSATVKDIAGNEKSAEAVKYTIDAPTAVVTGYGDNIESVLGNVKTLGKVSESVKLSGKIDPNFAHENSDITLEAATKVGQYGTFTFGDNGQWTYALNSDAKVVDALKASKGPLTEIFTVKDSEGKSYEVKVSINDRVADDGEHVFISATSSLLKDSTNVESDQGAYTIYTNDSLGEITGTASQGVEKVRVYVNKQAADTDAAMDSLGYPQYFEVAVEDGKWSLSEQDLTDGLQKTWWADQLRNDNIYLQVRAVDPTTGKVGDVSGKYTFVVDTVAPEATYVKHEDGKVTALISSNPKEEHSAKTGDEVMVKYTDQAGNVKIATGKVGEPAVDGKPYLSISVPVENLDPNQPFKVYVKDQAGNIGVNNDIDIDPTTVTLPIPVIDQYLDHQNNPDGKVQVIANGGHSDDPQGQISGTVVLNAYQKSMVDEVRIFVHNNPSQFIKIPADQLVPVEGEQDTYRWTTQSKDLAKILTSGRFAEGEASLQAATYDKDSDVMSEASPKFTVNIDVTAPEITIESIAGDQVITQLEKKDGFTVKGSTKGAEEGNTVTILVEGKSYTTTVGKDGKWSIDLPKEATQDLTDGKTYTITASVTDKAGNQSSEANSKATVNAAPRVTTQTQTVEEDSGASRFFQVKATDPEDDRIKGYSLKYEVLEDTLDPSKGSVVMDEYDDGHFIFTPENNFSGEVTFSVKVTDSYGNSTIAEQKIIVTPVADAPVLKTEMNFDVGELSLNKYTWSGISGHQYIGNQWYNFDDAQTKGSGISPTVLVNGINALFEHQRPVGELTNEMKSEGWSESDHGNGLPEHDVVYMNGYIYLEAGKDYKYTGSADDNGLIIIGDNESSKYVSWQGLPSTTTETFAVKESGFYTFNLYIYNQDGTGNYNFKVTEADGTDVKYFPSVEAIKGELGKDVHLAEEMTGKDGKGFYGVSFGYTGSENDDVELTDIVASLADRDGSETLSLTLTGLVEGTKLIYTSVDKDGGAVTSEATVDSHGTITVNGGANVTDFKDLSLDLPQGIATGQLPVTMTVTATEQGNGDAKSVTNEFTVTVNPPVAARMMATDESEEDNTSDAHVTKIELLEDNNTGGHSLEKVINFAINQSEESSEPSKIEFSEDFFNGLIHQDDLTVENLPNISQYFSLQHNAEDQTVTLSVDRDGVDDHYQQEELLLLTNQPTEISLEELLNNHQIVIG